MPDIPQQNGPPSQSRCGRCLTNQEKKAALKDSSSGLWGKHDTASGAISVSDDTTPIGTHLMTELLIGWKEGGTKGKLSGFRPVRSFYSEHGVEREGDGAQHSSIRTFIYPRPRRAALCNRLSRVMAAYSLLSTTRFDPYLTTLEWNNDPGGAPSPFFLLPFHLDRLRSAATQHGWAFAADALSLSTLRSLCQYAVDQYQDPQVCKVWYLDHLNPDFS
jgi:hypothetical protein